MLIVLSIAFGAIFFTLRILQYQSFFSFEWEDDARNNQLVYNIATALTPYQTIYQKQPRRFLNDRFLPICFFIAVFYRICPHIFTWYFLICFSYGFTSLVIYFLAKHILKDGKSALMISLIYFFYPPLHYAALGALDPANFALPFILLALLFLHTRKFSLYLVFMMFSNMCRDDIALYFFLLGVYILCQKYPKKWWVTTFVLSSIYFICSIYITKTFCSIDWIDSTVTAYNYIDMDTVSRVFRALFFNTKSAFEQIFVWGKMRFFVMLLYTVLFLPMLSILTYIPLPIMLLEMGFQSSFFNSNSYYVTPLIPFIFIGLISGLKRIKQY